MSTVLHQLILLLTSLFILVTSADYAMRYSTRLAKSFRMSEFFVSFFIVSVLSTFPEGSVAIISALEGVPTFGLGALIGTNVADLLLVFGLVALASRNGLTIKSEILKKDLFFIGLLLLPILLGLDGSFSRIDGFIMLFAGALFFAIIYIESKRFHKPFNHTFEGSRLQNAVMLCITIAGLLISAYYTLEFGIAFASTLSIPPILIGLTIISVGGCLPELLFSVRAASKGRHQLALGDVLGNVVIDATILVGITSIICPFSFSPGVIYITGISMFIAGVIAVYFIKSGKVLTKREGLALLLLYLIYLGIEICAGTMF